MSGDNPKLILEGRKTQTRRIVRSGFALDTFNFLGGGYETGKEGLKVSQVTSFKRQGDDGKPDYLYTGLLAQCAEYPEEGAVEVDCPYGMAGDRLWVREAAIFGLLEGKKERVKNFRADGYERTDAESWTPSIHMPRWASRITLEITKVRVERLQDISAQDCIDEGIDYERHKCGCEICTHSSEICPATSSSLVMEYAALWDSLHGKGAWAKNPWVWVLEFKRV